MTVSDSFTPIKRSIVEIGFLESCLELVSQTQNVTHLAYRVFATDGQDRLRISRICGVDRYGILYIGYGEITRINDLPASLTGSRIDIHPLGHKYRQLRTMEENFAPLGRLFAEVCLFTNKMDAKRCETDQQIMYREKYGENPPYNGIWEGY